MIIKENNNTNMIMQFIDKYVGVLSAPINVYRIEFSIWSNKENDYVAGTTYTTKNSYLARADESYVSDIRYLGQHKISKDIFSELLAEVSQFSDFRYEISMKNLKKFIEIVDNKLAINVPFDTFKNVEDINWEDFCAFSDDSWYDANGNYELHIIYTFAINNKVVDAIDLEILLND